MLSFIKSENSVAVGALKSVSDWFKDLLMRNKKMLTSRLNKRDRWDVYPSEATVGDIGDFDVSLLKKLISLLNLSSNLDLVKSLAKFRNKLFHMGSNKISEADCDELKKELLKIFRNLGWTLIEEPAQSSGGDPVKNQQIVVDKFWFRLASVVHDHFMKATLHVIKSQFSIGKPFVVEGEFLQRFIQAIDNHREPLLRVLRECEIDVVYPQSKPVCLADFTDDIWEKLVEYSYTVEDWLDFDEPLTIGKLEQRSSEAANPLALVECLFHYRNLIFRRGSKEMNEEEFIILWECLEKLLLGVKYDLLEVLPYKTAKFDASCMAFIVQEELHRELTDPICNDVNKELEWKNFTLNMAGKSSEKIIAETLSFDVDMSAFLGRGLIQEFGSDPTKEELNDNTVFGQVMKLLMEIDKKSGHMKLHPPIFTGSAVEGCSLARLSDPSKDYLEVEMDQMLICGYIDGKNGQPQDIIENIPDSPGFFRLRSDPLVQLVPPSYDENSQDGLRIQDGKTYVCGDMLKLNTQSSQLGAEDVRLPFQVLGTKVVDRNVTRSVEGPSAALSVKVNPLASSHLCAALKKELEKLEQLREILKELSGRITVTQIRPFIHSLYSLVENAAALPQGSVVEVPAHGIHAIRDLARLFSIHTEACSHVYRLMEDLSKVLTGEQDLHRATEAFSKHLPLYGKSGPVLAQSIERNLQGMEASEDQVFLNVVNATNLAGACSFFKTAQQKVAKSWKAQDAQIETAIACLQRFRLECEKNNADAGSKPLKISMDQVPCLYCPFWPAAANDYLTRKRHWPPPNVISEICKQGCFCVAKDCMSDATGLAWRWSFSTAEIMLTMHQSPKQRQCYFWFKSLFYQHLKFKICDRSLPSYLAKTIMLRECEFMSPDWWQKSSVKECVLHLLNVLYTGLQEKPVPLVSHLFLSGCNLLAGFPNDLIQMALKKVKDLMDSMPLPNILTSNLTDVAAFIGDFRRSPIVRRILLNEDQKCASHPLALSVHRMTQYKDRLLQSLQLEINRTYLYYSMQDHLFMSLHYTSLSTFEVMQRRYEIALEKIINHENVTKSSKQDDEKCSDEVKIKNMFENFCQSNIDQIQSQLSKANMFRKLGDYAVRDLAKLVQQYCTRCEYCKSLMTCGSTRWKCSCNASLCGKCLDKREFLHSDHDHCFEASDECLGDCLIAHGIKEIPDPSTATGKLTELGERLSKVMSQAIDVACLTGKASFSFLQSIARPHEKTDVVTSLQQDLNKYNLPAEFIDTFETDKSHEEIELVSGWVSGNGMAGLEEIIAKTQQVYHKNTNHRIADEIPQGTQSVEAPGSSAQPGKAGSHKTNPVRLALLEEMESKESSKSLLEFRDCNELYDILDLLGSSRQRHATLLWINQLLGILEQSFGGK